jgi:broad specificity phosphatase PhoE
MKTLVLVRHAHRDNTRRELDNGLSEKGAEQAKAIRKFGLSRFSREDLMAGVWLVSSPKLRCVETLAPLAKGWERKIDIHPNLDEQSEKEKPAQFHERVKNFLHEWTEAKIPLTILCSHGDWLPLAISELLSIHIEPKKGSWNELDWVSGSVQLKWSIPTFKHFT